MLVGLLLGSLVIGMWVMKCIRLCMLGFLVKWVFMWMCGWFFLMK